MGKSVFAAALIKRLKIDNRLLGGVFFTFNNTEFSNPYNMMLTIAYQIACAFPELQSTLLKIYTDVVAPSSERDVQLVFEQLILEPLRSLDGYRY